MAATGSALLTIQRHISDFDLDEEGSIGREEILLVGTFLGVMTFVYGVRGAWATHASHSSHASHAMHASGAGAPKAPAPAEPAPSSSGCGWW